MKKSFTQLTKGSLTVEQSEQSASASAKCECCTQRAGVTSDREQFLQIQDGPSSAPETSEGTLLSYMNV